MNLVDVGQLKNIIAKNTDFFGDKKRFKSFKDDIHADAHKEITDVELECLGYGHFEPDEVLDRFQKYTTEMIQSCRNIKSLKIQINGFDLDGINVLEIVGKEIETLKDTLKTLWIHTSHLTSCDLHHFELLLSLSYKLGSINFEEISLQFSHWKFITGPPKFTKL